MMNAHPSPSSPSVARRSAGRPRLFPKVKLGIEQLIDSQALPPGAPLESENQLAERFGVSRPLVRKALRELADEKRIITLPGKGHFVADPQATATATGTILCLLGATHYNAIWRDHYVASVVEGLEQVIAPTGHRLLFELVSTYKGIKDSAHVPLGNLCGVLLVPLTNQLVEPLLETLPSQTPCVVIGRPSSRANVPSVRVDHDQAVRAGVGHLMQQGHRRIGYLGGLDTGAWHTSLRYNAYRQMLAAQGCDNPAWTLPLHESAAIGKLQLAAGLPALLAEVTALFIGSGLYLPWTLAALRDSGRRIGQDLSIVTYDDIPAAHEHEPTITAVAQPTRQMGKIGAELLLQQIACTSSAAQAASLTLQGELIVRSSVVTIAP